MTQLNLSGRQSGDNKKDSSKEPKDGSISNQTVGALGALAMFAAVIVIGSCSRTGKPVAVQQPTQPTTPVSALTTPAAPTLPVAPATVAKAKTKRHRATTLSYVNREYGVALNFPRHYKLKSGDDAQLSWGDMGPFQMDFVHPGGVTLAAVVLPENSYPGTDFKSGSINLSVHPNLTSEACTQFAFPQSKDGDDSSSKQKVDNVKIGGIEFSEVENSGVNAPKQTDAKYYHAFSNNTCYEFALGVGTDGDTNLEGVTPVDRREVFAKLEKILATVKLQPTVVPEAEVPAPSAKEIAPDATPASEQNATNHNF